MQAMNIEGQDSIFGPENSVSTAQSSSQPQLPEPESKMDDSIDNQQQVRERLHSGTLLELGFMVLPAFAVTDQVFPRTWIWMRAQMGWRRRSLKLKRRRP